MIIVKNVINIHQNAHRQGQSPSLRRPGGGPNTTSYHGGNAGVSYWAHEFAFDPRRHLEFSAADGIKRQVDVGGMYFIFMQDNQN